MWKLYVAGVLASGILPVVLCHSFEAVAPRTDCLPTWPVQCMMPYGQPNGQMGQLPPPMYLQAGPPPVGGPYGFYPAMLPQQMGPPQMHQMGPPVHGMPPSPGRSSQPSAQMF